MEVAKSSKEYNKRYYEEHKDKMRQQQKKSDQQARLSNLRRSQVIIALNNGEYKRKPIKLMERLNITLNSESNLFQ